MSHWSGRQESPYTPSYFVSHFCHKPLFRIPHYLYRVVVLDTCSAARTSPQARPLMDSCATVVDAMECSNKCNAHSSLGRAAGLCDERLMEAKVAMAIREPAGASLSGADTRSSVTEETSFCRAPLPPSPCCLPSVHLSHLSDHLRDVFCPVCVLICLGCRIFFAVRPTLLKMLCF